MKLLKGKLYLDKVDQDRVRREPDGREYIEVATIINDRPNYKGKLGVVMQNTAAGERRIYLSNLYIVHEDSGSEET